MYRGYINFMKKRFFIVGVVFLVVAGLLSGVFFYKKAVQKKAALAEALELSKQKNASTQIIFEEGKHYHRISTEFTSNKTIQDFIKEDPGKIQVVEFFNYGCFWCSRLHPLLTSWAKKKPINVVFYSVPVVFNKQWETLGKAFFMVKNLGRSDSLDSTFFTAIHQNHINLSDEKQLKEFFNKQGVSEKQFSELYQSFAVNSELARAVALANAYHIAQSPVIAVNTPAGSFLLTAKAAGGEQALIAVLNHVVLDESKANKAGS